MNLLWKKYTITFELVAKDYKCFRYATVEFEQKRNWYWLKSKLFFSDNLNLHRCLIDSIKQWFGNMIRFNWMFEGENPNRLIDDTKLRLVNSHINTNWNLDWQPSLQGKIRNIKLTYLVR